MRRKTPLTHTEAKDARDGCLSSFDVLKRVVSHLDYTHEQERLSALDPCDLVRAVQSVRASGWDVFLDQLTDRELELAIKGDVSALQRSLERLDPDSAYLP